MRTEGGGRGGRACVAEGAADVGTVAAGLALPLAFFQLGGLRRDRLRGQVERVAPWAEPPRRLQETRAGVWWSVSVFVRNGSELPVFVDSVGVDVRLGGTTRCQAPPDTGAG